MSVIPGVKDGFGADFTHSIVGELGVKARPGKRESVTHLGNCEVRI
jgi:hypothetical protein